MKPIRGLGPGGALLTAAVCLTLGITIARPVPSEDGEAIQRRSRDARKAMVEAGPRVREMIDRGRIRLLEEYAGGGRLLVEDTSGSLAAPGTAGFSVGGRNVLDRIMLRARTIDTSSASAASTTLLAPSSSGGRLEIVQFHGPVKGEWLEDMTRGGAARTVAYVPHNAYIVWVEDPAGHPFSGTPLQWREALRTADRLSPELISREDPVSVTVQVVRFGDHEGTLSTIRARARKVIMEPSAVGTVTNIRVTLDPDDLIEMAGRPEVLWIEPYSPPVLHDELTAVVAAGFIEDSRPEAPGYARWLEAQGLDDLRGTVVDVTDTGLDNGVTDVGHPGLRGRVVYSLDMTSGDPGDCTGHGTNVAGILAGAPVPGNTLTDAEGYILGLGVAPSLSIGSTRIFDCSGQIRLTRSFSEIISTAYQLGARIGNNSWGGGGSNYNTVDAEYDAIVRDVNLDPSDGEQGFLPVFSVGNEGPSAYSIGWPGSAKNVLSVGASEGYRPGFTDGCGVLSSDSDSVDHVALFSSRGPTGDGRIKPDILAPGSHVHSLASTDVSYQGFGVCNPYLPLGQRLINLASGTSQAAPHVSGAAAIAREIYQREHGAPPGPAMIKAILVSHAHDMGFRPEAPSNTNNRPNFAQGWGRLDIGALAGSAKGFASDQQHVMTATGEVIRFEPLVVDDITSPVTITLVWTDAPGTPIASPWVNDLDLRVEASGSIYMGNVFDDGFSVTGGEPDFRNNVESVILAAGVREFSISVEAANIAGDGVPSAPSATDQDFALYVDNARLPVGDGKVTFASEHARCGSDVTVRVFDRDLRGLGGVSVDLGSGEDIERLSLREDPAGTGAFSGSMAVAAAPPDPGDGRLQTSDGLQVGAVYRELDDATGEVVTRAASIPSRCALPRISELRVTRIGNTQAEIRWTTDRPADSRVRYGLGSSRTLSREDSKLVTDHMVRITGLKACAYHTATVTSTDGAGMSATAPASPLAFSTGPGFGRRRIVFRDDMEAVATRWSHQSLLSGLDDWELGFPGFLSPAPVSGLSVWGTNLDGYYRIGADSVLISPPIDLEDAVAPELTFSHVYSITGSSLGTSRHDGGWVEVSTDGGLTWSAIVPIDGYPGIIDEDNPHLPRLSGVYSGVHLSWSEARFDLSTFSGSVVRIRFHFWQDPAENNARSFGWLIDDVEVTAESSCHRGRLRIDAGGYGCSSAVDVILSDSHLDTSSSTVQTVEVIAASPHGDMPVLLTETFANSGEFAGAFLLSGVPAQGRLLVEEGDSFTVEYADPDTGGGAGGLATVTALVPDCTPPPAPSGIGIEPAGDGRLSISWSPIPPEEAPDFQGYRVHYDTDGPGPAYSGSGANQGPSPVRTESVAAAIGLDSLGPCAAHFVTVSAFDSLGNESPLGPEVVSMAGAAAPCSQAILQVDREKAGCNQSIAVTVSDANADPDAGSPGSIVVEVHGPSHPGPQTVSLTETGTATGVFIGSIPLSPVGGGFQVSEGDLVSVIYQDSDDGLGGARTDSAVVRIVDCRAPEITDVRVAGRAENRAVIRWSTDELSSSEIRYGPDESLGLVASDPQLTTDHAVPLDSGLSACSTIHFTVSSTDIWQNSVTLDDDGRPLTFGTFRPVILAADDFEGGEAGWTHQSFDSTDEWELGQPLSGVAGGPPAAFSGTSVWGTDLDGRYEFNGDMRLVSPTLDLSGRQSATLFFKHWVSLFSSGSPTGLDDGAFVEISLDGGQTWSYIKPDPSTPYNDTIGPNPYTPFAAGVFSGNPGQWQDAVFPLDQFIGERIRIGFHLYQDRAGGNPATGAGWYIDDFRVFFGAACHDAGIEMDRGEYGCHDDSVLIRLSDLDLNLEPLVRESTAVLVTSGAEPSGENVLLLETGPASGVFEGTISLSTLDAEGTLLVGSRDSIVAEYEDADDGTGSPRVVRATASTLDCSVPEIGDVEVRSVLGESFRVDWITTVPADSRVHYGSDQSLASEIGSADLTTDHSVTVDGLDECSEYFFTVSSTNEAGIIAREDASRPPRTVTTRNTLTLMMEDFEAGAPGWKHAGQGDTWQFGTVSGDTAAATALGSNYPRPPENRDADFVLTSPPINLVGVEKPLLKFDHSYDFEPFFLGGDGGWVEGWNGSAWIRLVPEDGYPGTISEEANPVGLRFGGYSGEGGGTPVFDLSGLGSRITRIRFHVFLRSGIGSTGAGWTIDDVSIAGLVTCRAGRIAFEAATVSCAEGSVTLTLNDRDLDGDPATVDQVPVSVVAASIGLPVEVTLVETGPASGLFRGLVVFDPPGHDPVLPAIEGDTITATYLDADDGTGTSRTVAATIDVVDCDGPRIERFTPLISGDNVVLRWATDRPATSEAILRPDSGPDLSGADHRLGTSHAISMEGLDSCTAYTPTIASEDEHGNRTVMTATPLESIRRTILFEDDMEGADPGWHISGVGTLWGRGVPTFGPPTAFSGQTVFGTDLLDVYAGGTNNTLTSPPIDLRGVTGARLTFWHWYEIFGKEPPNSFDDGAWVEILVEGNLNPTYIQPIRGYSDIIDANNGVPMPMGTPVYAGRSDGWERADFDLTPFAGRMIRIRFRLWNDAVDLIINGSITGAGWYLDDVAVWLPSFCHPAPTLAPGSPASLPQGGIASGVAVSGGGFRQGLVASFGPGITVTRTEILSPSQLLLDVSVAPLARVGTRDLTVINPDGQYAVQAGAIKVSFASERADINGSGRVDGTDLFLLAEAFGSSAGEPGYSLAADLDGDGVIDGFDLALLAASFGARF